MQPGMDGTTEPKLQPPSGRIRFGSTTDFGHKAMRVIFTLNGNVPREV